MGAKAPEKLKLRRQSCKCEVCGRKFLNIRALTSHRKFVHKTTPVNTKRLSVKKPPDLQNVRVVKKKIEGPPVSKTGTQLPATKVTNKKEPKVTNENTNSKKTLTKKRIEFKCPKCIKVFSVYFSAYRHIQKNHCVDKNDEPVQPNSSDLIRPIRVEMFDCCNKFLPVSEEHVCTEKKIDRYMCLGCQKTFDNLQLFEQHVKVLHAQQAECLFFANNNEFTSWKEDLEASTKTKFQVLAPSEKSKQIYHCSHEPPVEAEKILLCPSTLTVTEHNNSYQVTYFKEHFGHSCLDSQPLKYKKNSILPFLKDTDIQHLDSDEHIYDIFKSIMNNITASAAKADVGILYSLLGKALSMTLVLNNIDHEEEPPAVNKSMTDDQITKVLSEVRTYPAKRKADAVKKDVKQIKQVENNENEKDDSLNNKEVSKKPVPKKIVEIAESLPSTPFKPIMRSSPSFNDTYKDFVDQNFKATIPDTSTPKKQVIKKKAVVKTKIGQFKVRPSLSPKGPVEPPSPVPINDKPDDSPKTIRPNLSPKVGRPPLSPKLTHTSLPPKKIKPSLSPKRMSPKTPKALKYFEYQIKPDIEYEVREQENDCNILVLKI